LSANKIKGHDSQAHVGLQKVREQIEYETKMHIMRNLFKFTPKDIFTYYNPVILKKKAKKFHANYALLYYSTKTIKKISKEAKRKKIIADYIHTLELDYKHAKTYNKMGKIKFKSGKYKEAIKYYNKAIKLAPMMVDGYDNRANAKLKLKQYKAAGKDFKKAKELEEKQKEISVK